jgi:ABC-type nitrate/sulfonate/bicarbonate transport system permease component
LHVEWRFRCRQRPAGLALARAHLAAVLLPPFFMVWFGVGKLSKTIVIIAALFPMISISAM